MRANCSNVIFRQAGRQGGGHTGRPALQPAFPPVVARRAAGIQDVQPHRRPPQSRKGQLEIITALKALPRPPARDARVLARRRPREENYDHLLAEAAAGADFPVRFLGDIPDERLGEIYAQADIFAMTSMPHKQSVEGFGLVYLEAGAHGLPIVAHAIGGVPEAVIHDYTGLLVEPGDIPRPDRRLCPAARRPGAAPPIRRGCRVRALARSWQDSAIALFGQRRHSPAQTDPMLESRTQIAVRYAETDMMGIVYHGNYLPWFEVGRTSLLKECGLPYKDLEAKAITCPSSNSA